MSFKSFSVIQVPGDKVYATLNVIFQSDLKIVNELTKSDESKKGVIQNTLLPLKDSIWMFEQVAGFLNEILPKKLRNTPDENIIPPDPVIAGPAIESLRYAKNNPTLADMYANLIANTMDKETVAKAHPGFTDIIRNLTSDEGLILNTLAPNIFKAVVDIKITANHINGELDGYNNLSMIGIQANVQHIDLTPSYIDNLCRLRLIEIPSGKTIVGDNYYDEIKNSPLYKTTVQNFEKQGFGTKVENKVLAITTFGNQFKQACLADKGAIKN